MHWIEETPPHTKRPAEKILYLSTTSTEFVLLSIRYKIPSLGDGDYFTNEITHCLTLDQATELAGQILKHIESITGGINSSSKDDPVSGSS
jgi:hypothetical protein